MATRVSKSGDEMSADRPHWKRETRRLQRGDLGHGAVAGDDDLLLGLEEVVEGVEELLLDALLAGEELHIVHQQDVHVAVTLPELRQGVLLDGVDVFVGEFFRGEVGDLGLGVALEDAVPDGVHQVGLAEAGGAVEEEGVVGLRGRLGDGKGGGMGELVILADDEVLEGVARIERAGGGQPLVIAERAPGGGAALGLGGGLAGRGGVVTLLHLLEAHVDHAAGGQAQALRNQVEIIVVNPNGGEIIRHAQRQRVFRGLHAADGLEPHGEHILGEQTLQVAFDGFPEAGLEDGVGHGRTGR